MIQNLLLYIGFAVYVVGCGGFGAAIRYSTGMNPEARKNVMVFSSVASAVVIGSGILVLNSYDHRLGTVFMFVTFVLSMVLVCIPALRAEYREQD